LTSAVDGEINLTLSFGCLGDEALMYKYQPDAEMRNVMLFKLGTLERVYFREPTRK
jgi:hypothetical protein